MAHRTHGLVAFSLALAAASLSSGTARAFCRTWSCDPTRESCPVDPDNKSCPVGGVPGTHVPLFWPQPCVGFSLNENASAQLYDAKKGETVEQGRARFSKIVNQAFASWQKVSCPAKGGQPAGAPSLQFANLGFASCDKHEYNQGQVEQGEIAQGNTNLIVFRDSVWPHKGATNTLALTTLTFNTKTGEIYDADMEINGVRGAVTITTGDTGVDTDLLSVVTHEVGHFIGVAHSPDAEATMYAVYSPKSTSMRTLAGDDENAVCSIYPPSRANLPACDPTPRHGYSAVCGQPVSDPSTPKGCSVGPIGARSGSGAVAAALVALGFAAGVRRRRDRRG